ncbi:hypothetical protein BC777_1312 [Yoonia maricola]|uniref:Uncharacterized protein n=1 Tax=Yoonia maricola TaxID=420999 RepID=A0A2M8WNG1_9RHOB|nr:hypothetical protein BC777_1312 [Yoonia maricola]
MFLRGHTPLQTGFAPLAATVLLFDLHVQVFLARAGQVARCRRNVEKKTCIPRRALLRSVRTKGDAAWDIPAFA